MPTDHALPKPTIDDLAHAFEEEEQAVSLRDHGPEDWVALAVFWVIVGLVFLQFFTRYALNNSLAWTEEVAVNALIVLVFMGAAMCTRTTRHIHVDLIYHHVGPAAGRWLSRLVDAIRVGFFAYAVWLMWRYVAVVADERLISVRLSRGWFLYPMLAAFAIMFLRAVQVMVRNWRRGYSVLERPELAFDKGE
ncbi:TRAP transporter small permease [Ruixingdingia sedimenti]|uniref:TRAP transporter small permease protein n=1 Tax=Ruixingdingia sedimenti TaxID=3073604 RepID=A0ABU1F8G7_9RHOB|nr:TRAP transporter small permease [Xinfangfangia sp. LG-4]MDR5653157.1 TRAP transporter small permease [Xinfangfangia sp. LG-4]